MEKETKESGALKDNDLYFFIGGVRIYDKNTAQVPDEEYDKILSKLEEKIKSSKLEDVYSKQKDFETFSWDEILSSMKTRIRYAEYVKNHPCEECGKDNTLIINFKSSEESWEGLYGRMGLMRICPDCLAQLGFLCFLLN